MLRDYLLLEKIGQGSFGTCSKCLYLPTSEYVVLKEISFANLSPCEISKTSRESSLMSKISHPYLITFYDSFIHDNSLYISMEYAIHGDVSSYLPKCRNEKTQVSINQIWTWLYQMTCGIEHLHKSKMLHRDLKTANLFLDKRMNIKIGDFGLSTQLTQSKEYAESVVGTPLFISPEMYQNGKYNDKVIEMDIELWFS